MAKTLEASMYKARIDVTDRDGHRFEMLNISDRSYAGALAQRQAIFDRMHKRYDPKDIYIFTMWGE